MSVEAGVEQQVADSIIETTGQATDTTKQRPVRACRGGELDVVSSQAVEKQTSNTAIKFFKLEGIHCPVPLSTYAKQIGMDRNTLRYHLIKYS